MSNESHSRKLNTGAAHSQGRSAAPHSAEQHSTRKINRSGPTVYHSAPSARPAQTGRPAAHSQNTYHAPSQARPASTRTAQTAARNKKSKKKKGGCLKNFLVILLVLLLIAALIVAGVYKWVSSSLAPEGSEGPSIIDEIINTPEEYKGDVVNVLVCGIRQDMTDMIMYVNFDVANRKINMLQIPRDTYPGEGVKTGGTGKINAVANHNGGIGALVKLINDQYKLPIDYYVTIDIESLREIVDVFGGIEVYVPREMSYKGSVLHEGLQTLHGDSLEFFLRCRHGEGFAQGDPARLDMQRYFYQALFQRVRTSTVWDLAKLAPVALKYIETDIPMNKLISMGVSFLQVDSADIMMCRLPIQGAAEKYNGKYSIAICEPTKTTELLNTYFRTYGGSVDKLNIPTLPAVGGVYDPNIQYMGQLDTETADKQSIDGQ